MSGKIKAPGGKGMWVRVKVTTTIKAKKKWNEAYKLIETIVVVEYFRVGADGLAPAGNRNDVHSYRFNLKQFPYCAFWIHTLMEMTTGTLKPKKKSGYSLSGKPAVTGSASSTVKGRNPNPKKEKVGDKIDFDEKGPTSKWEYAYWWDWCDHEGGYTYADPWWQEGRDPETTKSKAKGPITPPA